MNGLGLFFSLKTGNPLHLKGYTNPIYWRKNSSDLNVIHHIFVQKEYDIPFPFQPKYILDGGANIGLFSIWMQQKFLKCTFISVEPDPENFGVLQKNISGISTIHSVQAALWNSEATLSLKDEFQLGKWAMVASEDANGSIQGIPIDILMQMHQIPYWDIVKLDIETSEKQLFNSGYENWLKNTRMLIIELHDHLLPGCSEAFFKTILAQNRKFTYSVHGEFTVVQFL